MGWAACQDTHKPQNPLGFGYGWRYVKGRQLGHISRSNDKRTTAVGFSPLQAENHSLLVAATQQTAPVQNKSVLQLPKWGSISWLRKSAQRKLRIIRWPQRSNHISKSLYTKTYQRSQWHLKKWKKTKNFIFEIKQNFRNRNTIPPPKKWKHLFTGSYFAISSNIL